jgi:hypothetical protein
MKMYKSRHHPLTLNRPKISAMRPSEPHDVRILCQNKL